MNEISLEPGDQINLTTGYIVEIIDDLEKEPYEGADLNTGELIPFTKKEIECIKKSYIKPDGGDRENYWYFYCAKGITPTIIANYARFEFEELFFDMSIETIINRHIYWGTDNFQFNGNYNGDTYVLYNNLNLLPEDLKKDAEAALLGV